MKRVLAAVVVLCLATGVVVAETVYMKSGSKIVGKILEEDDDKVRVEVDVESGGKAVITIERSRIDRIETATTFQERIEAAHQMLKDENFRQAEVEFRDLVHNEPKEAQARLGLAKALVGIYKYNEAIKTLEHYLILVNTDRDSDLMLYLADQYLQAREYRDAKKTAREAAALYPTDTGLQAAVDEFLDRVDRVRSGSEQLRERETAESAERKRRVEERKSWDEKKGNSFEAEKTGLELEQWGAESWPKLALGRYLEIDAPRDNWTTYYAGGDAERLREDVTRTEFKLLVDEVIWLELYDHQKSVLLYGWYYQLKELYPRSFPKVTVVCNKEERGKLKEEKLARSSWDGRRDQITVERWTKENRDPMRPRRVIK